MEVEHVFVVPATIQLAGAEIELVSAFSRESRLKAILGPVRGDFDFVIIDCPPSLGLLTINALTAATGSSSRSSASTTRWRACRSSSTASGWSRRT